MIYFLHKIVEFGLVKLYNFYINHFRKEKRRNYEEIKKSYEPFIGMRYGFVRTYCPTCAASTSRRDCAKSEKKVTIPATVNINGVKCTVVQVGANAFKGYSKLTEVTVGKHVTEIGKNAFAGCKKLAKMTLKGTKLTSVKEKAFKNTSAKLKVAVPKGLK